MDPKGGGGVSSSGDREPSVDSPSTSVSSKLGSNADDSDPGELLFLFVGSAPGSAPVSSSIPPFLGTAFSELPFPDPCIVSPSADIPNESSWDLIKSLSFSNSSAPSIRSLNRCLGFLGCSVSVICVFCVKSLIGKLLLYLFVLEVF